LGTIDKRPAITYYVSVEFLSVREFSKSPKTALTKLALDGKAVLINNGKPSAILVKTDGPGFEKTLALLQKLEFMQNVTEMQLQSMQNGNSAMTLDEINAEIAAARAEMPVQEHVLGRILF
jgi:hypothetical protein